jgi:hypothetical protein
VSSAKGRRAELKEVGKTSLQTYFKAAVESHGGMAEHFTVPGKRGVPDFLVTWPMVGWAKLDLVEVKVIGGAVDPLQEIDHEHRRKFQCYVHVLWTKKDVDDYVFCRANAKL